MNFLDCQAEWPWKHKSRVHEPIKFYNSFKDQIKSSVSALKQSKFKMRFLGILFLFSPSWQLQHISPEKILNFSSQQRLGKNFKLNHFNQQVLTERHAFSFGRQTPRNDEIKEIFDEPAKILCAEFYMKHYGQGFCQNLCIPMMCPYHYFK